MTLQQRVDAATIICREVLHISHILQASLNLQRGHTCGNQSLKLGATVHILQREQMLVTHNGVAVGIHQLHRQTARLRTGTAVGRTSRQGGAQITLPAHAHAEGTVHETLQLHRHRLMYAAYLLNAQLTRQHNAAHT